MTRLLSFLLLVLLALAGWWLLRDRGEAPAAPEPVAPIAAGVPAAGPQPARPLAPGARELPMPTETAPERTFALPDGSRMPVLNGAVGAPSLTWPADRPWSPIVRRFADRDGLEWYEHADGSYSTTVKAWRSDLGREEPVTRVLHPASAKPARR